MDEEIKLFEEKIYNNNIYIEEELIKKLIPSTEKGIEALKESLFLLRQARLELLEKENKLTMQSNFHQKEMNLLSFGPKNNVLNFSNEFIICFFILDSNSFGKYGFRNL